MTKEGAVIDDHRGAVLTGHTITALETSRVRARYPRTVGRNARLGEHGRGAATAAVTVRTDTGHSGWGMVEGPVPDPAAIVGRPLEELFDPATGVIEEAAAPLDPALHDLTARLHGVPLATLLGDHGPREVPCYSGAIYLDDLDPEEAPRGIAAVLDDCAADAEAGFRAFKLKIGRGHRWMNRDAGLARDIEVTRAVREAYPAAVLMADANDGYTPEETVRYLHAVAGCELLWIEEPFREDAAGLCFVREHLTAAGSSVLIADGESDPDEQQLLDLAAEGLLDVLLMDVLSYGITAWRRIMPDLIELGVAASPHAWGQPTKTWYAAQLAAGLGNVLTVEGVPGATEGIDAGAYALREGRIRIPDVPGHGLVLTTPSHPAASP